MIFHTLYVRFVIMKSVSTLITFNWLFSYLVFLFTQMTFQIILVPTYVHTYMMYVQNGCSSVMATQEIFCQRKYELRSTD